MGAVFCCVPGVLAAGGDTFAAVRCVRRRAAVMAPLRGEAPVGHPSEAKLMVCSLQRDVRRLARQRDAQVKGGQV